MLISGFGCKFHDLKYIILGFFHIPCIYYKLEGIKCYQNFVERHQFTINLKIIQNLDKLCLISPTCTSLAPSPKICRLVFVD